jgi:hypothetical protein
MSQIALLVALSATTGLFGNRQATCQGGSCGYAPTAYRSHYTQPGYRYPAHTYNSYYYAPRQAAPTAAPAPAVAPQAAAAPSYYYYPTRYSYASAPSCPNGTCYRR